MLVSLHLHQKKSGIGFIGFSLASWLTEQDVSGNPNPLPDYLQSLVLEDHGIANMLKDTPCSRMTDTRYSHSSGWNTGEYPLYGVS